MRARYHFNARFLLLVFGAAAGAEAQVDRQLAQRYFQEATELCERGAGRLWGVSLWGPMVISIIDQRPDADDKLISGSNARYRAAWSCLPHAV
jgi:hypothetical protein